MMPQSKIKNELEELLKADWSAFDPMPPPGASLVIYGAGNCGRQTRRMLEKQGYHVEAFVDARAASIGSIDTIPCLDPASPETKTLAGRGVPAVIAVFNYLADLHEIDRVLRGVGFKRIVSFYELNEHLPGNLHPLYWLANRAFYKTKIPEILEGFDLFDDPVSREIFLDLIKLRVTYQLDLLRNPLRENQYFLPELFKSREPMRLVDGGAYTGDTLGFFLDKGLQIDAVTAFEPDLNNFKRLQEFVRSNKDRLGSAVLFPCGLDEATGIKSFNSDGLSSSALSAEGDSPIQVVALDEVIPSFAPTLIKLDIEGAEVAALKGARDIITSQQPDLAICVYHTPAHLWEIPLLMRSYLPDHKLMLRYHQLNGFEVVCYAGRA